MFENDSKRFEKIRWAYIICFLGIFLSSAHSEGKTTLDLRKQLLSNYNKSVSPGFEDSPTDVGIILVVRRISEFDESHNTLNVEVNLHINWMDRRLRWNDDEEYRNITWFTVNPANIWKPKMNVFNSGRGESYGYGEMPVFLVNKGRVWWAMAAVVHPVCVPEDLRWYPRDTHTCQLSIGPLYPQEMIALYFGGWNRSMDHNVYVRETSKNLQWDMVEANIYAGFVGVGDAMFYPIDNFVFNIRRQGQPILATFIPLMLSCMFLSWSSFTLPPRGEPLARRLGVATLCLFLTSSFLNILIKLVPGAGQKPPIIVKIYTCIVLLMFFTCLHTVIIAIVLRKSSVHIGILRKLPVPVQYLLGLHESQSGGAKGLIANEESPPDSLEQFQKEESPENSWDVVAAAYDRVHIILQVIVLILLIIVLCLV